MEVSTFSTFVKKSTQVDLSEGTCVQLNLLLKNGGLSWILLRKKYCVTMRVLNLSQDLFVSCLKVLVGVGTKDKHLVRTEISSSVNVWSESLRTIFLLYVLMDLVVKLQSEDWRISANGRSKIIRLFKVRDQICCWCDLEVTDRSGYKLQTTRSVWFFIFEGVLRINLLKYSMKTFGEIPLP